jgi:hypothetical protein
VNLSALAVILVFARELLLVEAVENFCDGLGRFRQHGLERYSWLQLAILVEISEPVFHDRGDDDFVAW